MKSKLFNALKIVVTAALLAYVLLVRVNLSALGEAVMEARWGYLALGALIALAGVALRAVRWMVLLRALEIQVPLGRLVELYFAGSFFNAIMPTGLGGDAIRVIELARQSKKTPEAIGTVMVDRATGLWTLYLMGLLALPFMTATIPVDTILPVAAVAGAVVVGGWGVMGTQFVPWLGSRIKLPGQDKLERFYRAISGCGYAALGQACGISLVFNLMAIAVNYLIALGLNVHLPLGVFFVFSPIVATSLLLPSVGGLGVREGTSILMYGTVGVSDTLATAMGLMTFGLQTLIPGLVGAILYVRQGALGLRSQLKPES